MSSTDERTPVPLLRIRPPAASPADRSAEKVAARRAELATATLTTLAELGYARTSLRDIAQNTDFSHGVLHYYFRDKVDLITYCVREYKAVCVTRYDRVVATATTPGELQEGFLAALTATLVDDAALHRLWYDLRGQSMFEPTFRDDVRAIDASLERMVWRVVERYAELSGGRAAVSSPVMYALFDGLFQQALLRHLADDPDAADGLRDGITAVIARVLPPA